MLRSWAQQVIKNTAVSTSTHSGRSCGKESRPACMDKTFGGMPSLRRQKLGFPHIRLKRRGSALQKPKVGTARRSRPTLAAKPPLFPQRRFAPESWVRSASRPYLFHERCSRTNGAAAPSKTQGRDGSPQPSHSRSAAAPISQRRFAPESWVRSASRPYLFHERCSSTSGAAAPSKTQGRDGSP
jgi:hypothetical protein